MADRARNQLPAWYQPTAQVAAAMLCTDDSDRILLVKPTYAGGWNLPGGVVEVGESPAQAAEREVREEIGLDVAAGALICVDYRPPVPGGRGDALRFLFRGARLTSRELDSITLAPDEIRDWCLVDIDNVGSYLGPLLTRRLRSALLGHTYLEEGQPTAGAKVLASIELEGVNYRLRPFRADDHAVVEAAADDDLIPKITTVPADYTVEAGRAFIDRQNSRMATGEGWSLAIATSDTDTAVGQVGLWISQLAKGRAEIGYWVAGPARGRGAASEAVRLIAAWAFQNLDVDRLSLFIEPWNDASIRTATNAGFEREALLRNWERIDGQPCDMLCFVRTGTNPHRNEPDR